MFHVFMFHSSPTPSHKAPAPHTARTSHPTPARRTTTNPSPHSPKPPRTRSAPEPSPPTRTPDISPPPKNSSTEPASQTSPRKTYTHTRKSALNHLLVTARPPTILSPLTTNN